jgi:beta-glucosidase
MSVLFPFGHGLSYTTFEYSGLMLDKTEMDDTETLTAKLRVTNSGSVLGKEIVQLYIRDASSTVARPVRELKGFVKVALEPGETQEVQFTLDKRAFAYYERVIHNFYVESGEFVVEVGASSRDIRLSAIVNVRGTAVIPVVYDRQSTVGDIMESPKGREVFAKLRESIPQTVTPDDVSDSLGQDANRMIQQMMMDMPLGDIQTFAGLNDEKLDALIAELNGNRSMDASHSVYPSSYL